LRSPREKHLLVLFQQRQNFRFLALPNSIKRSCINDGFPEQFLGCTIESDFLELATYFSA
jgi:hypothetical protein